MPRDHQALRACTLRRAMLRPDRYLATALAEWPDEDLATLDKLCAALGVGVGELLEHQPDAPRR